MVVTLESMHACPHYDALPVAISVYDELTFTYDLTLNPTEHQATLAANYIIGKMINLWLIKWIASPFRIPLVLHCNSTGCYRLNRTKYSNETLYQFLENQGIKVSIVLFQSEVLLEHKASSYANGQKVTEKDLDVSNSVISTQAEDGEKIFETSFITENTYNLYNCIADKTEKAYSTYDILPRTSRISGFEKPGLQRSYISYEIYSTCGCSYTSSPIREGKGQSFGHDSCRLLLHNFIPNLQRL